MKFSQNLFGTVSLGVVFLTILCGCIVIKCITLPTELSHSLTMGERKHGDKLLFNGTFEKGMVDHDERVSRFYRWPDTMSKTIEYKITKFQIEDKGMGGNTSLYGGGVGERHIILYLQSKIGKGIKFQIVVYGYKYDKKSSRMTQI